MGPFLIFQEGSGSLDPTLPQSCLAFGTHWVLLGEGEREGQCGCVRFRVGPG